MNQTADQVTEPTDPHAQAAAAVYQRDQSRSHVPYGILGLTVTPTGISRVHAFGEPSLVTMFGFPAAIT